MSNGWRGDLDWSSKAFVNIIWPVIQGRIGGGRIVSIEQNGDRRADFAKADIDAGVDVVQELPDGQIRYIAVRNQKQNKQLDHPLSWDSFTIRKERESGVRTELEKRSNAIKNGCVYPYLWIHSYLETEIGPWAKTGIIQTRDLIEFVNNPENKFKITERQVMRNGAATFLVAWWRHIGDKVEVVSNPELYPPSPPPIEVTRQRPTKAEIDIQMKLF